MSQPAGPPPYEAIYSQGVRTDPVQSQPQPQVVYIVESQTHVIHGGGLRGGLTEESSVVVCSTCNQMITTLSVMKPAMRTHMCALLLCLCGLWPCCAIPYCMPSCNDVDHYCPSCKSYIGSYTG